jgi:hypothetical protein
MRHRVRAAACVMLACCAARAGSQVGAPRVLESFDDASAFSASPSDGVALTLRGDSGVARHALRMDVDFQGHAGYAVARRVFSLPPLPAHWALTLWVRGNAKPNTLEIKLVDSSGQNVWWLRRPELQVTETWTRLRFRASELSYAWGPLGGGPPRNIAALEIAFTAGEGGKGWLALDEMTVVPLAAPVADTVRPLVTASSSMASRPPASVLPSDFATPPTVQRLWWSGAGWRSAADSAQSLTLSFGGPRALSGLVLDWATDDWAADYDVESSDDGRTWNVARVVRGSAGGRRLVHLPATDAAYLRIVMRRSSRGRGYALHALYVLAEGAASTRTEFLERVAAASAPGTWPRPLTGQQSYWTVVGVPRDERDALFSEDGNLESRPASFSLEPFLRADGRLLTWRDGVTTQSLDGGSRPIPSVRRVAPDVALGVTTFATGAPGRSVVWLRYRVVNLAPRTRRIDLIAVARPVQVNPPWQFLGTPGGAATIRSLRVDGTALVVNGTDRVVPMTPALLTGGTFDAGAQPSVAPHMVALGSEDLVDPTGFAEGALTWTLKLAAHDSADRWLALPTPESPDALRALPAATTPDSAQFIGETMLAEARAAWDRELGTTHIDLPAEGAELARTLKSALAYVLINARGAAIQPGTRSYRRSWIRDGALTSSALMRLGHAGDARAFLDWYVPYVFTNGKTPCCVDARGADPVTENDADGELLYLAAEYFRMTGDSSTVRRHWPTLAKVAAHLDSLRESRRTAQYRGPDSLVVFGLLPPSISHEGYSAKPAYSYWDDWWGVRGLADAGLLARVAGDSGAAHFTSAGQEMRRDVVASAVRAMALHRIHTLPGAADLGDLDPTSSTIALEPAQALADLPRVAVLATFDSAWATLQQRQLGGTWDAFTPYEWRDVGAYVRLGQPARAHDYAQWLLASQRPRGWNQWAEVVWHEPRTPKFVGDMPHGWVMSDFARATLDMIAYERELDSVLVVGAGIPLAWARAPAGVKVEGLRTWWGTLSLDMRPSGSGVRVVVRGVQPPGGIELHAPFGATPHAVLVDGKPATTTNGGLAVMIRAPAVVEFVY